MTMLLDSITFSSDLLVFLGEHYYVTSVVCLSSVTFVRHVHMVELFVNILHHPMAQGPEQFVIFFGERGYEKVAFFDKYLALFRNR